ncbi:hypothetical protein McanMca71_004997 [Microsporum canis]|uniref:F-box domain-containing protein n=1 Tax=Arthroderma otae (strain ATCC MYA-4605 / CBS 113480) TaxID=554155 RepID=C5FWC3_ARTOC|nr:conserved hypothetical protein [Microsporum canis CBS 113480]EEQ34207.1 conserved hypothetical protein [Microsporum canis CBS 113480]
MDDPVFKKPFLPIKRAPIVSVEALLDEPLPVELPVKVWFYVICLSTAERLCGPYRLRRLLLNRSADDLMCKVAVPEIHPLSDAFMEATEPKVPSASSSPNLSELSATSHVWTQPASPVGQASMALDGRLEASPNTVSNMLGQLRDGELLPRETIQLAAVDTFSIAKGQNSKRKRDEESLNDDSSNDERPLKLSRSSDEDTPSLQPSSPNNSEKYKPQLIYLPAEIHRGIIDKLDLLDIIHLGLTSRYFLRLLANHLRLITTRNLGKWAGESILCLGDVIEQDDFPPAVFKDPHLQYIFAPELDKLIDTEHPTLLEYLRECGPVFPLSVPSPLDCGFLHSEGFNDEFYTLPVTVISEMIDLLCPSPSDFYPTDAHWVLRNLTTKEYALLDEPYGQRHQKACFGLGDLILLRTCWSSKPPAGLQVDDKKPIHRGIWAGHRFEIVQLYNHNREMISESRDNERRRRLGVPIEKTWKDATASLLNELSGLWARECGRYWEALTWHRPVR